MNQNNHPQGTARLDDDAPIDEVDEQLVAYLDGELRPQERAELEQRLGHDSNLRARLRTLQNGWDLLDDLPMATPSAVLLESTIRMAATTATLGKPSTQERPLKRVFESKVFWLTLLTMLAFGIGAGGARVREAIRFRTELTELPIAIHTDAYLHATDLALMRTLMQMPQWQQTVSIAERFGEWDFRLHQQIDLATIPERQKLLQQLPLEHQQVVLQSWQQFEKLDASDRRLVMETAERVAAQSDAENVLATMDRFARWRDSLAPAQRDLIASGDLDQRMRAIEESLQRTVRLWTQQTSRLLTDNDIETIYHALRHIARLRILAIDFTGLPMVPPALRSFGSKDQMMEPRTEAFFLRRLFESVEPMPSDSNPRLANPSDRDAGAVSGGNSRGGNEPSRFGPPPGLDFLAPTLGALRPVIDQMRGPLREDELWMIESVLSDELTEFLAAAGGIESLQEELLRSWADETLRRTASNRSGTTVSERYELLDPSRRDQLDLLPPDKMLESLRDDDRRRRP